MGVQRPAWVWTAVAVEEPAMVGQGSNDTASDSLRGTLSFSCPGLFSGDRSRNNPHRREIFPVLLLLPGS